MFWVRKDRSRYNKKAGEHPALLTHVLHLRTKTEYQNLSFRHVTSCGDMGKPISPGLFTKKPKKYIAEKRPKGRPVSFTAFTGSCPLIIPAKPLQSGPSED